jgi:hypothetical protein
MTISTTQIGTYTAQITLLNETSSAGLITALDTAVVAAGWAQYDIYANGTQRVYRCLNKDGITFKYIKLYIDPVGLKIATTSFESWNATTHVPTNECSSFSHLGACGFSLNGSDVLLMISTRWCIVQSFIRAQPSQWSGVIEVQREAAEDTAAAGYPCFAWVSSSTILEVQSNYQMASFPRSRSGLTGLNAIATSMQTPYTRIGLAGITSNGLNAYAVYPWDTSKRIVHSLRPTIGTTEVHGRMYGIKAMHTVGAPYSRITMPVDADFNYSATGTATEHWVLGETAQTGTVVGSMSTSPYGPLTGAYASVTSSSAVTANATGTFSIPRSVIYVGSNYYVGHASGVAKYDSTTLAQIYNIIAGTASDIYDVIYDGKFVYASHAGGIYRIDPVTDVVTSLALSLGAAALFFDGSFIWAAQRGGSRVNNLIFKIDATAFTLLSSIIIQAGSCTIGGICSDFNGNLYVSVYDVNTGSLIVNKIVISTGVATALLTGSSASIGGGTGISFDGNYLHTASSNGTTSYYTGYTLAGVSIGTINAPNTALSNVSRMYITRVGSAVVIGHYSQTTNSNIMSVLAFGYSGYSTPIVNSSTTITLPAPASGFISSLVCDGNRAYAITASGYLIAFDNINHPDDNTTYPTSIRARLVLPK